MLEKIEQHSLFKEEELNAAHPLTIREWHERATRLANELRLGQWDYDRLLPERKLYEARVKKWKGVQRFRYPENKFDAIEARSIVRFLKGWTSCADNLQADIDECIRNVVKITQETS